MALDQSALLEMLDALRNADASDRIKQAAETIYQALIDAELTAVIGAGAHERTASRTNLRNGSRPRTITTTAGDLELRIPKLRTGSFFPALLERRRRVDQCLFAVVMQAYLHGTSTRRVDDLVKALGADSGISKSEVSRICADLDTEVGAFRDRPLSDQPFPYMFLDATYCKARVNHRVVSQAVVIATGVAADGRREVLGFEVGDSEDGPFWTAVLRSLKSRGLSGVQLVISDAHTGLRSAIEAILIGTAWQRCRVHFLRNVLAQVPKGSAEMVAAAIRTIFAQPDAEHVRGQLDTVPARSAANYPRSNPCCATRPPTSSPSPISLCRIGKRSGLPTRWNGSTKRSNAVPTSSASFPTPPHCYDWPAPCSSKPTTNGKSPTNATYPKPLWLCSNPPPTQATNPLPSPPLSRHSETHRASGETPARSARDCRAHR
jgi:putative transposase